MQSADNKHKIDTMFASWAVKIPNIFLAICMLGYFPSGLHGLNCYKCISISCPEEPLFCNSVKDFVFRQLPEYYYYMENGVQYCPEPIGAEQEWELIKTTTSYIPCSEEKEGEATCTLGRFKVNTLVTDLQKNVTTYGTVLGCAKRKLLESTRAALKQKNQCSLANAVSLTRNSLKHYMELEHCPMITDMCHDQDFCIHPQMSLVKSFKDVDYGISAPMSIFIGFALLLGVIVAVLTFAGIRFNA